MILSVRGAKAAASKHGFDNLIWHHKNVRSLQLTKTTLVAITKKTERQKKRQSPKV